MTWRETWLQYFPDWPPALLDRFELPIRIELFKYDGSDALGFVPWWASVVSPPAQGNYRYDWKGGYNTETNFGFSLMNPQNQKYLVTSRWDIGFWFATKMSLGFMQSGVPQSVQTNMNQDLHYENRIWINLHVYMNYDSRLYQPNFGWNYATIGQYTGSHEEWNGMWSTFFADYYSFLIVAPNANAQPYNGADTILALHENGVDNGGVDYAVLSDFIDFRNAYSKYSQQLAAQKSADRQQQKNEIAEYKNNLGDKLQAEKNALQNLTLTMQQAMKNESASAERDMVNTVINAQNLKLSLLAAMR